MRRKAPLVLAAAVIPLALIDHGALASAFERGRSWLAETAGAPALAHIQRVQPELSARAVATITLPEVDVPSETGPASDEWGELPPPIESDSEAEAPPEHIEPDEAPVIASIARETWVFAEPRWQSRRLGYLRAGAIVSRDKEPATHQSCRRGWYRIAPQGYVCARSTATIDKDHPIVQLSQRRPDRWGAPYTYVLSRYPTPPFYARLPSRKQMLEVEPGLDGLLRKYEALKTQPDFEPPPEPEPTPHLMAEHAVVPGMENQSRGDALTVGQARVRSGFALLGTYLSDDRQFGLTTELHLIPLDRTRMAKPSTMTGLRLSDELTLPVAIAKSKHARVYAPDPATGAWAFEGKLDYRAIVGLTGQTVRHRGHDYYEMNDGRFVQAEKVVRVDRFKKAPRWAQQGKKWIDVSILEQSLTAYEGLKPVFTTLVSTGADGLAKASESHATVQGTFLIHTKHVSVTMDGDDAGDEFDLRDVPFVQYFHDGYALHGAYWHDDFGIPRSHGCVNLSPQDAAWLFRWTDPEVPEGWHASLSLKNGTTVYIHP